MIVFKVSRRSFKTSSCSKFSLLHTAPQEVKIVHDSSNSHVSLQNLWWKRVNIDSNDRALNFLVHKGACFSRIAPHQQRDAVTTICCHRCLHLSIKGKRCSGSAAAIKMHLQWEICIGRRIYTEKTARKSGAEKQSVILRCSLLETIVENSSILLRFTSSS